MHFCGGFNLKSRIIKFLFTKYIKIPPLLLLAVLAVFLIYAVFKPLVPIKLFKSKVQKYTRYAIANISTNPQSIFIEIDPEDISKIAAVRDEALKNHILVPSPDSFVSAKVTANDQTVKARIRLRGILEDHWRDPKKWSFKIQIKDGQALFGLTDFSVMHPQTRGFIDEWLYVMAMKREGQIAPNVSFVNVIINGVNNGIYILEEDLSFRLIESNERIAGPILDFDQNLLVGEWARGQAKGDGLTVGQVGRFLTMPTQIVNDNEVLADSQQAVYAQKAASLLEAFRVKSATVSEVFDVSKLAKYMALRALFAAEALDPADIKFYYNPVTSKIELIGLEISSIDKVGNWFVNQTQDRTTQFVELFFQDEKFVEQYLAALEQVSRPSYLDSIFSDLHNDLNKNLNTIYSDHPDFLFTKVKYYQNQSYIREKLNPIKGIHAYLVESNEESVTVEIGNIQDLPVEIMGITGQNPKPFSVNLSHKLIIPPKKLGKLVDYQKHTFPIPNPGSQSPTINVAYRIFGVNQPREEVVYLSSRLDLQSISDLARLRPNIDDFDFLETDLAKKEVKVMPGIWRIEKNLIVPSGFTLKIGSGVSLDLLNSSLIFLQGPINITGTRPDPVIINSSDGTGQGLVVIGAQQNSLIRNAVFKNLKSVDQLGWSLSGSLTFYESPLNVYESLFSDIKAEDALNIIRSSINIGSTSFFHTSSDAVDLDFSDGKIENSNFEDTGGDAIDLSGGNLEVRKVLVKNAGDKGISVGENSTVSVNGLEIEGAFIGLASKDHSIAKVENLKINKSRYGLVAYQKKAEFGPGQIYVVNLISNASETPYLVEKLSKLSINQKEVKEKAQNVYSTLYNGL